MMTTTLFIYSEVFSSTLQMSEITSVPLRTSKVKIVLMKGRRGNKPSFHVNALKKSLQPFSQQISRILKRKIHSIEMRSLLMVS